MPRNISFALTTEQIRHRTKTVTRRLGWRNLQAGTVLNACVKCMGLKPGERVEKICQIRVENVRREPLSAIMAEGQSGADKEGFPLISPRRFIDVFCEHMGGEPDQEVTRIEFSYLENRPA